MLKYLSMITSVIGEARPTKIPRYDSIRDREGDPCVLFMMCLQAIHTTVGVGRSTSTRLTGPDSPHCRHLSRAHRPTWPPPPPSRPRAFCLPSAQPRCLHPLRIIQRAVTRYCCLPCGNRPASTHPLGLTVKQGWLNRGLISRQSTIMPPLCCLKLADPRDLHPYLACSSHEQR